MSEMNADSRTRLDRTPQWNALGKHREELGQTHLRELFEADPERGTKYTLAAGDLHIDYAKHLVTDETLALLRELAAATGVAELRDAMFRGEKINITEDRAVLHTALRAPESAVVKVDGEDVVPEVHSVLRKMAAFSDRVRSGSGRATPASASRTSSTSASAAPTSARRWRTRPCGPSATAT